MVIEKEHLTPAAKTEHLQGQVEETDGWFRLMSKIDVLT